MNEWLLPVFFGLFGFIEPCAVGATLLFLITLEGRSDAQKIRQVAAFTITRTVVMGLLGAAAAIAGTMLLDFQKAMWLAVGLLYIAIGILYFTGRIAVLKRTLGPGFAALGNARGSAALGMLFGLNVPACAGPLLLALLAQAAAQGASRGTAVAGFRSLALFGFALSLPMIVAVVFPAARRFFDWIGSISFRIPRWTGGLFVVLGLWSMWFGFYVSIA